MYGLTRATTTLIAAGVAGLLIWIATQINDTSNGGYWAAYGLIAGAGLIMALSQLLGGWTKWGMPRLSASVFLIAFVPVAIAALWVVIAAQPHGSWFRDHILAWSGDIHITGLVHDLKEYVAVLAFGIGLVFGFSFDTTGPRTRRAAPVTATREPMTTADGRAADEPVTAERGAGMTTEPSGREPVTTTTRTRNTRT
jgi:hypothetical protein